VEPGPAAPGLAAETDGTVKGGIAPLPEGGEGGGWGRQLSARWNTASTAVGDPVTVIHTSYIVHLFAGNETLTVASLPQGDENVIARSDFSRDVAISFPQTISAHQPNCESCIVNLVKPGHAAPGLAAETDGTEKGGIAPLPEGGEGGGWAAIGKHGRRPTGSQIIVNREFRRLKTYRGGRNRPPRRVPTSNI